MFLGVNYIIPLRYLTGQETPEKCPTPRDRSKQSREREMLAQEEYVEITSSSARIRRKTQIEHIIYYLGPFTEWSIARTGGVSL